MNGEYHFIPREEVQLHICGIYCLCEVRKAGSEEIDELEGMENETVWIHTPFNPLDSGDDCLVFQEYCL